MPSAYDDGALPAVIQPRAAKRTEIVYAYCAVSGGGQQLCLSKRFDASGSRGDLQRGEKRCIAGQGRSVCVNCNHTSSELDLPDTMQAPHIGHGLVSDWGILSVIAFMCAGINRYEVENAKFLRERTSDPLGPESCAATARDTVKRRQGYRRGGRLSCENLQPGRRRSKYVRKAT